VGIALGRRNPILLSSHIWFINMRADKFIASLSAACVAGDSSSLAPHRSIYIRRRDEIFRTFASFPLSLCVRAPASISRQCASTGE
jgi:hypothetical protein